MKKMRTMMGLWNHRSRSLVTSLIPTRGIMKMRKMGLRRVRTTLSPVSALLQTWPSFKIGLHGPKLDGPVLTFLLLPVENLDQIGSTRTLLTCRRHQTTAMLKLLFNLHISVAALPSVYSPINLLTRNALAIVHPLLPSSPLHQQQGHLLLLSSVGEEEVLVLVHRRLLPSLVSLPHEHLVPPSVQPRSSHEAGSPMTLHSSHLEESPNPQLLRKRVEPFVSHRSLRRLLENEKHLYHFLFLLVPRTPLAVWQTPRRRQRKCHCRVVSCQPVGY